MNGKDYPNQLSNPLNALSLNAGRALPGLTLVFVSPEPPSPALEAAAREARIPLHQRPLTAR